MLNIRVVDAKKVAFALVDGVGVGGRYIIGIEYQDSIGCHNGLHTIGHGVGGNTGCRVGICSLDTILQHISGIRVGCVYLPLGAGGSGNGSIGVGRSGCGADAGFFEAQVIGVRSDFRWLVGFGRQGRDRRAGSGRGGGKKAQAVFGL